MLNRLTFNWFYVWDLASSYIRFYNLFFLEMHIQQQTISLELQKFESTFYYLLFDLQGNACLRKTCKRTENIQLMLWRKNAVNNKY